MLPIFTPNALALFTAAVVGLLAALGWKSPTAATLSAAMWLTLGVAFALTIPLARRMRRQRLELAWWLEHGRTQSLAGAVVPGTEFTIGCYMRQPASSALRLEEIHPLLPEGLRLLSATERSLHVPPRSRAALELRLVADAPGRYVVQGLALSLPGPLDLFRAPLYFPNPLAVNVLPRAGRPGSRALAVAMGSQVERSGKLSLRRRGGGTELRELRELQPGDPYKSIAWKASARRGTLMVREVEREVQRTTYVVLDVAGTMRGGAPGMRKLDRALELAAAEARQALARGDRVGLITVDGRILAHVAPDDGTQQMLRVYEALLEATEIVDEDLTEADELQVAERVGRYLRRQDGRDFRTRHGWDREAMAAYVRRQLEWDAHADIRAVDAADRTLRRFCRMRGVRLPYRPDPRGGSKAPGLRDALRTAGAASRDSRDILLITDWDGVVDPTPVLEAIRLLRRHRHRIRVTAPEAVSLVPEPRGELEADLHAVYALHEQRRLREARSLLAALGVTMHILGRDGLPGHAVSFGRAGPTTPRWPTMRASA